MSLSATLGKGSYIKWNGIRLTDVKKIGAIPLENPEVEVTDLDSTAKEYIPGLKDYGSITIEGNYVVADPGQAALKADAITGALRTVTVYLANQAETITFTSFVKSLKFGEADNNAVTSFTAELRISGAISEAAAPLTALTTTAGTISPDFAGTQLEYFVKATSATITVTPTSAGNTITVIGNGISQVVVSGVASNPIAIAIDTMTLININVVSTGGSSAYKLHVTRETA